MAVGRDDTGIEADMYDAQEQQRDLVENPSDSEQTVREAVPDGSTTSANAADVQEQSIEVSDHDEDAMQ